MNYHTKEIEMLALTRRNGERIVLFYNDKEIIIEVYNIRGNQASLGIDAPKEVDIVREELLGDRK